MDGSATIAPLVVLGAAALGLLLVGVTALLLRRRSAGAPPAPPRPVVDDLPDFLARPPGSPGAPAPRHTSAAPVPLALPDGRAGDTMPQGPPAPPPADDGVRATRLLLALATLALALIAGAAAAGLPAARADHAAPPPSGAGPSDPPAVPDLPAVPAAPAPGQPGAGELAFVSLPLGPGDTAARLSFGGVVLEPQPVGATLTRPAASLSTSGHAALLHLRLPTWNCLAPELPDDPAGAGCVPSVTEYGDLPSPALSMTSDGTELLLQGRVPTYTRPNGSGPLYTGHVYDVTLTVRPGRRLAPGRFVAQGVLTLGSGTTRTDGDPLLDVLTRGR